MYTIYLQTLYIHTFIYKIIIRHDLMAVLLQYFDNIPSDIAKYCLCNGYSTLCPRLGRNKSNELQEIGKWSLFDWE